MGAAEERLHALDALRASAMLLGIVLHAAMSLLITPFPWIVRDVSRSHSIEAMVGAIHGFRMQIFFFLAGFFAALLLHRYGAAGFMRQRALRIGVPFLVGWATLIPLILYMWNWPRGMPKIAPLEYPTMHLWFLEMLLILYVLALVVSRLGAPLAQRVEPLFDGFIRSPWKPLVMVPPTVLLLWQGPMIGEVDMMGRGPFPGPRSIAYFGLFFAVGWWLRLRMQHLQVLTQWLRAYFAVALAAFLLWGAALANPKAPYAQLWGNSAAALYAWTMTFAMTGLFLRFVAAHRPWMRYLADASYWMYLMHLPLLMWMQVLIAKEPVNGWLKLAGMLAVATVVLLLTYALIVRRTWIGLVLNGPRPQPA